MAKKILLKRQDEEPKKKILIKPKEPTKQEPVISDQAQREESVESTIQAIESQQLTKEDVELPKELESEIKFEERLAEEKSAKKLAKRNELISLYKDDLLFKEVTLDTPESKEVYKELRNELVDKISIPYQYDRKVAELKKTSSLVTDKQARSLVLDEFNDYVYNNIFDTREKTVFDAIKNVGEAKKKYESNPENEESLLNLVKANNVLKEARGAQYKPLLDENGEFVDQQIKEMSEADRQEIQIKSQEYSKWNPDKLYNLYTSLVSKHKAIVDKRKEVEGRVITKGGLGIDLGFVNIPITEGEDVAAQIGRIRELEMPIIKDLKAISHSLLLNRDLSSVKTNFFQFVGRGLLEGLGAEGIHTESQMQEQFNKAVLESGGQITEAQYDSAVRDIWDKSAMAIGQSLPIMVELALTKKATGAAGKILNLSKRLDKLKSLARLKYGKTGEGFVNLLANVGKNEAASAIEYGLTPDEKITAAMGVGEALGGRLSNFIFKGKNVGRLGEFLIRTTAGTATETVAEFAGDFANNLSKNGFDGEKALEDTFGKTGDEAIDNILVTGLTCAMFSGTSNVNSLLKIRSSIESMPVSKQSAQALDIVDEMIDDVSKSNNQSTDDSQSTLTSVINENGGVNVPGVVVSSETDNSIKKIVDTEKVSPEEAKAALEEVQQIEKTVNADPESFSEDQLNSINQEIITSKTLLESHIEQQENMQQAPEPEYKIGGEIATKDKVLEQIQEAETEEDIQNIEIVNDSELTSIIDNKFKKEEDAKTQQGKEMRDQGQQEQEQEVGDKDMPKDNGAKLQDREKSKEEIELNRKKELDSIPRETLKDSPEIIETIENKINQKYDKELKSLEKVPVESEITLKEEKPILTEETAVEGRNLSRTSDVMSKTLAMASQGSKDLSGVTLTQDNASDFEKVVKEATNSLKGLEFLGSKVKSLVNKGVNITRRIQNAKSRGSEVRQKGEKYSTEDLTRTFLSEVEKVVNDAKTRMATKIKNRVKSQMSDFIRKGTRTVSGKQTGVIETSVIEDFIVAKSLIEGREVMDLNRAIDILQDPDSNDTEIAQADGVIYGSKLVEGHENWGMEEWAEFENTIKEHAKSSRANLREAREKVRRNNQKIREEIDANVDMKNVPSTQAEMSAIKEKREGYVSPEEASNRISRKMISLYRKTGQGLKDAKNAIVSSMMHWNLHIGTLMSLFDANESTAESGVLYDKIVRPLQNAFSEMTKGGIESRTKIFKGMLASMDPEYVNKIESSGINKRSAEKKIKQRFYDLVEKRIFNSDRYTIDVSEGVDGQKESINMSVDDLMKLYAWSLDPKLSEELELKHGITSETMDAIKKHMGSDLVTFVDYVVKDFMRSNYQKMNNVYKDVYYTNMPFVENYFPIRRSQLGVGEQLDGDNLMNSLSSSISAIKNRSKTKKPLEIVSENDNGFMKILYDHINDSEHFIAYAKPIRDVNAALKSRNLNLALNHYGLKKTIMDQLMTGIGKARNWQPKMIGLEKLYNAYAVSALSGKLVQLPKQASSFINLYPEYAEKVGGGAKALTKFLADAAYKSTAFAGNIHAANKLRNDFMLLYEKSPLFKNRVDSEMVSIDFTSGTNRKPWRSLSTAQKFAAALRAPTKYGDLMGIILGGSQVYKATLETTGNEAKAIEAFEEYEKTQQAKNPLFYNSLQLSNSQITKLFTAFRSSQILMVNKSIGAIHSIRRSIKQGGYKNIKSKDVRTLIVNWSISNMLFQSIAALPTLLRGDDEEYMEGLIRSGIIGPLNGLFMLGDVSSWMYDVIKEGWEDGSTKSVNRLDFGVGIEKIPIQLTKPWVGKDVDVQDATALTTLYLLQFAGLPAETTQSVGEGVTDVIEDGVTIEAIEKLMGYTEFQRTGGKKKIVKGPGF